MANPKNSSGGHSGSGFTLILALQETKYHLLHQDKEKSVKDPEPRLPVFEPRKITLTDDRSNKRPTFPSSRPNPSLVTTQPLPRHHPVYPGGPLACRLANALVKAFKRFWIPDRHWIARINRAMTTEKGRIDLKATLPDTNGKKAGNGDG